MNAFTQWWKTGNLGDIDTTVDVDKRSVVFIAIIAIIVVFIVMLMIYAFKKKKLA
jgi:hypothetical protein